VLLSRRIHPRQANLIQAMLTHAMCSYITIHWDKVQRDAMGTATYRYNEARKHGILSTIPPDIQVPSMILDQTARPTWQSKTISGCQQHSYEMSSQSHLIHAHFRRCVPHHFVAP